MLFQFCFSAVWHSAWNITDTQYIFAWWLVISRQRSRKWWKEYSFILFVGSLWGSCFPLVFLLFFFSLFLASQTHERFLMQAWLLLSDSQIKDLSQWTQLCFELRELPSVSIRTRVWVWRRYCDCGEFAPPCLCETPEKATLLSPWGVVVGSTTTLRPFGYDREGAGTA